MTESQINFLKEVKESNNIVDHKSHEKNISDLINFLKSYKIISKKNKNSVEVSDGFLFHKLMDIKSMSDFEKWYSDKDKSIVNNDFSGSTIGQFNQSDFLRVNKTEIKQINPSKTNEKQHTPIISFIVKFWWAFIIPLAATIVGILIEKGIIDIGFNF